MLMRGKEDVMNEAEVPAATNATTTTTTTMIAVATRQRTGRGILLLRREDGRSRPKLKDDGRKEDPELTLQQREYQLREKLLRERIKRSRKNSAVSTNSNDESVKNEPSD
ncbi:uncharacterized protein LAJ45_11287 [Morchella importuna]|uniref:uncharacterized protein n=1 Tax=Morchella importuna TaxID=1174673 RepID=UPI001E8EA70D|nr:uncharacterized protein LAJ45_11287 [Morchella importuna]KAH8144693.1 hypothetical protein LAJ45_11287 [Morchella importuna]